MNARLLASVDGEEIEIALDHLPMVAGRDEELCDLVIDDEAVSSPHATFFLKETQVYLKDEDSTNGTLLNDEYLAEPTRLKPKDIIEIGEMQFVFECDQFDEGSETSSLDETEGQPEHPVPVTASSRLNMRTRVPSLRLPPWSHSVLSVICGAIWLGLAFKLFQSL